MSTSLGSARDRHYLLPAALVAGLALGGAVLAHDLGAEAGAPSRDPNAVLAWGFDWTPRAAGPATAQSAVLRRLAFVLDGAGFACLGIGALVLVALYATRADARRGEWTIRRAVGASRKQLLVGASLEGATVAVGALAVASLVVAGGTAIMSTANESGLAEELLRPAAAMRGLTAVALVLVLSLAPFLAARRITNLAVPPVATRGIVVPAAQLGVTLAIFFAAARLAQSHDATQAVAAPRALPNAYVYEISLPEAGVQHERSALLASALETLDQDPAVAAASLTSRGMLVGLGITDLAITDCGACWMGGLPAPHHPVSATYHLVSADTFDAVGISVVAGRGVGVDDGPAAEPVAVINEALAQHHFERHGAVGRRIRVGRSPGRWHRVVGIVDDSRSRVLSRPEPVFTVYLSALQFPAAELDLMVNPASDPAAAEHAVAETLRTVLASPVPMRLDGLRQAIGRPVTRLASAVGVVGALSLLLATYGVGVVAALSAGRRRREYALRQAVGARARDVRRLVFTDGLVTVVLGLAIGWWLDLFVSGVIASAVGSDAALEASTALGFAGLLAATSLVSAVLTTWKSARLAPARFLELPE